MQLSNSKCYQNMGGNMDNPANWISAIAAIFSALATGFAALAAFRTPITAAKLAATLSEVQQSEAEKRRLKLWVFGSIMQDRPNLASPDCVRALNLIDALYSDVPSVRNSWSDLYAALTDSRLTTPEGGKIRDDKINSLLHTMATHLNLGSDFRPDDYRRVYYPDIKQRADEIAYLRLKHEHEELISASQRKSP